MSQMSTEQWEQFTDFLANTEENWHIAGDMTCSTARLFVSIAAIAGMPNSAAEWIDSHRNGCDANCSLTDADAIPAEEMRQ